MKKRLFIGIKPSRDIIERIAQWQMAHHELKVRWTKKEGLHITLIPPWYSEHVQPIVNILKAVKFQTIPITFHAISPGPIPAKPRLIWAEGLQSKPLEAFKSHLHDILDIPHSRIEFIPHITMARISKNVQQSLQDIVEKIKWHMKASSFILYESKPSSTGANYETIDEFPSKL